jgi:hypothetical protein
MSSWAPVAADELADRIAAPLAELAGVVRVAVDGPPCAGPHVFAAALCAPVQLRGRRVAHVVAESFWHDASLRLEHGREDVESYRSWLDADALRREVLDAAVEQSLYLPSLRDPDTNRSTREPPRTLPPGAILLVSGTFLLGRELPFDLTVHLAQSPSTRARRTAADEAWTLPAFDAYDRDVRPAEVADLVIKLDDPRHPAVRWT